jgi:thiosulfate/3-mercaptopyruvate sulfurtransferase
MTRSRIFCFVIVLFFAIPVVSSTREIAPFVSADWLNQNSSAPGLLIVDVRSGSDYRKGHIPGAVSASLDSWAVNKNKLLRELPAGRDLLDLMGSLGMKESSKVVIVGKGVSDFDRADAIRVAWTILTAGIKNVSVLDGGFPKWLEDKKTVTADQAAPAPGEFRGKIDESAVASKQYVLSRIGKSIIVDSRTPDVFFGVTIESFAQKPGHIKEAVNLPAPWAFTKDGILRSQSELENMANEVTGGNKSKETIVYCGVGVYASVWSYVLTEMLGYKDVKLYDGSMQEWVMDPPGPIGIFGWH